MNRVMGAGGAAGAAAAAAAAAAAEQRRRREREEEEMTTYQPSDLEGREFKILRANTRRFRDAHALRAVLEEEARAGWELVEKFDDRRLRLKRRVEWREKDAQLGQDPYRSRVGLSETSYAWAVAGSIILAMLLILVIVLAAS